MENILRDCGYTRCMPTSVALLNKHKYPSFIVMFQNN